MAPTWGLLQLPCFRQWPRRELLAPVTTTPPSEAGDETGKAILKESTTISFQTISNSEDRRCSPVLTDWDKFRKWRSVPNQQTLIVTFDDLSTMILKDTNASGGFVIDPYGQKVRLEKKPIATLKGQPIARPYMVEQETKVLRGEPKESIFTHWRKRSRDT